MARGAGHFIDHLEWLKRVPGAGGTDGFGQKTDGHPNQGYLWCAIENLAGGRATAKESERQERTATIRIRGRVGIAAGDRLRNPALSEVWTVGSVVWIRADNETVCDVTAPKFTTGGGTAG